jgi:hypothetical protein
MHVTFSVKMLKPVLKARATVIYVQEDLNFPDIVHDSRSYIDGNEAFAWSGPLVGRRRDLLAGRFELIKK